MIFIAALAKAEPFSVGRLGIAVRADTAVLAVFIEITAIFSSVIENSVENYLYIKLVRLLYQRVKCLVTAEHRVDLKIVARVVFVVRVSTEDRVEIDNSHAHPLEVFKLLGNAPKRAAEEHIVRYVLALNFGVLRHSAMPIVIHDHVGSRLCRDATLIKSVDKDLVHRSAVEPLGSSEPLAVDEHCKSAL